MSPREQSASLAGRNSTESASGPVTGTIAERLDQSAGRAFVGRADELRRLRAALAADELPFVVAFIHGPGGIGKSRLLQTLLASPSPGVRSICLDCRDVEPTPRGFLNATGSALGLPGESDFEAVVAAVRGDSSRVVFGLDTFEVFGLLETWLRMVFLPALPVTVLTVIAGRDRPKAAWATTPGWSGLIDRIGLRALSEADALEMLRWRGLTGEQARRANAFARGHPLALELAAAALRDDPDQELGARGRSGALEALVDAFLSGLPYSTVAVIEAATTSRRVTEPILRALLDRDEVHDEFTALRRLPFATTTHEGLLLHDVVRDTVAGDLAVRDPDAHATYRRRAVRLFTAKARQPRTDLWQATADLVYLIKNPILRDACFPAGSGQHSVEPATPGDGPAIVAIIDRHETPSAAGLVLRWWSRHPESFAVARNPAGQVDAFVQVAEIGSVAPEILDGDPIAASWMSHLRRFPAASGDRVLGMRRWLGRETGEGGSPAVGACWLDVKRLYMELRPRLSRLYSTIVDLESQGPIFLPLGFAPLEDQIDLGGARFHPVWLEFGAGSVDGWLSRLIDAEVLTEEARVAEAAAQTGLTRREVEVLRLVCDGCSNRQVAERLYISEKTAGRHVSNIFAKLDVHTRAQAVRIAVESGLTI